MDTECVHRCKNGHMLFTHLSSDQTAHRSLLAAVHDRIAVCGTCLEATSAPPNHVNRSVAVFTVPELAQYLRVHTSTIYRLLKKHEVPAFKIGSDWRFNQESIDTWWHEKESLLGEKV